MIAGKNSIDGMEQKLMLRGFFFIYTILNGFSISNVFYNFQF